jgi:hypothetical protein
LGADDTLARWGEAFVSGVELFNCRAFFEAHEAWEALWKTEPLPRPKLVLQGLIQIAAGYHKYFAQKRPDVAARLLERGLSKLVSADAAAAWGLGEFAARVDASRLALMRVRSSGESCLTLDDVPKLDRGGIATRLGG